MFALNAASIYFFRDLLDGDKVLENGGTGAAPKLKTPAFEVPLTGSWTSAQKLGIDFPEFETLQKETTGLAEDIILSDISFDDLKKAETGEKPVVETDDVYKMTTIIATPIILAIMTLSLTATCLIYRYTRKTKYATRERPVSSLFQTTQGTPTSIEWTQTPTRAGWMARRDAPRPLVKVLTKPALGVCILCCCIPTSAALPLPVPVPVPLPVPLPTMPPTYEPPPPTWTYASAIATAVVVLIALCVFEALKIVVKRTINLCWLPQFGRHQKAGLFAGWKEQCDIYLQVSTVACGHAVRLYLGSILGPPVGIVFDTQSNTTVMQAFYLDKGWFHDYLYVEWGPIGLKYQGKAFPLPERIKICNPWSRCRLRRFESQPHTTVISNVCVLYNSQLLVRPTGKANVGIVQPNKPSNKSYTTYFKMASEGEHHREEQVLMTPSAPPPAYAAGNELVQRTPNTYCVNCQACDTPNLVTVPK
jgi:hypothetical protein